ncbi:MAG: NAD-dependent epimerase/dehydratase family protein [Coriobacteriales bacterium]|nr:NAD-dependent epimerase/dehydratase family protein [Coriobacteriales bacterium]
MSARVAMVTGVAGFVGSHLVERLLDEDYEVHGMDIADAATSHNLDDVRDREGFHYTRLDIRDAEAVRAWYRPEADVLFHLASIVGVRYYMEDPLALVDIVVGGTRNLLGLAAEHDTRLLFSSTSEIYGKNPAVPWAEDADRVLGPTSVDRWSYSSSKAVCEHMIYGMSRVKDLRFSIVRFFNVYGPRQNPIYVVSQSVYKALRGEPPLLYDTGQQTRCFTYVEDVIDGILAAATQPDALGEVFNLGNDRESTMAEAVAEVCKAAGIEAPPLVFDTEKEYGAVYEDIPRRIPGVEKARKVLGWQATTSLADGVRQTVEWAREHPWYLADRG